MTAAGLVLVGLALLLVGLLIGRRRHPRLQNGRRRKDADVPISIVLYPDSAGVCNQANASKKAIRGKVGDKVTWEVLNLCSSPLDLTIHATNGDPFNDPPQNDYEIKNIQPRRSKDRQFTIGKHANTGVDTREYKFDLRFNGVTIDPRLEVDP